MEIDGLFEDAARLIVNKQQASTSLLQRQMKLGYMRSIRIMNQLHEAKIVGEDRGTKPREVLIKTEEELTQLLSNQK